MSDRRQRASDVSLSYDDTGKLRARRTSGGSAHLGPHGMEVLEFCATPQSQEEVMQALGAEAGATFERLAAADVLVAPEEVDATPGFFVGFGTLTAHRRMLADTGRLERYRAAIQKVVKPGDVVLDAGTGTGVLACLAAKVGARRVYAVDNGDALELARLVVDDSKLSEIVTLVRGDFSQVALPEPVDVIVTETFGPIAFVEGASEDVARCCERHLRPGGTVIPSGVELWAAPVGQPGAMQTILDPLGDFAGVSFEPVRRLAAKQAWLVTLDEASLGAPPVLLGRLPFPGPTRLEASAKWTLDSDQFAGWLVWFTLQLADGTALATGPLDAETHWGQTFFPAPVVRGVKGKSLSLEIALGVAAVERRAAVVDATWQIEGGATVRRGWRAG